MRLFLIIVPIFIFACSGSSNVDNEEALTDGQVIIPEQTENDSNEEINIEQTVVDESAEEFEQSEYDNVDWDAYEESMTKDFSFVILISTKSYDSALKRAEDASEKLGYPLNLRDLHPNEESGLSLPEDVCQGICGGGVVDYPQYLPRNDWGESKYVSIEYSNGFEGFTPGYYIVVVASGEKGDPIIQEALDESKVYYEDAYAKTCGDWMGCGC